MRDLILPALVAALLVVLATAYSVEAEKDPCLGAPPGRAYPSCTLIPNLSATDTDTVLVLYDPALPGSTFINELTVICRSGTLWVQEYGEYADTTNYRRMIGPEARVIPQLAADSLRIWSEAGGANADIELRGGF